MALLDGLLGLGAGTIPHKIQVLSKISAAISNWHPTCLVTSQWSRES